MYVVHVITIIVEMIRFCHTGETRLKRNEALSEGAIWGSN